MTTSPEIAQTSIDTHSNRTKKILFSTLITTVILSLIAIAWIAIWSVNQQQSNSWLVTAHFNPKNAGLLMGGTQTTWPVILASEEFASLNDNERTNVAKNMAAQTWKIGGKEQGYIKSELDNWFQKTAKNYSSYPIKKEKLVSNVNLTYRDFSSIPFPRANKGVAAWRLFSTEKKSGLIRLVLLFIVLPAFFISFVIIGIGNLFLSKQISIVFKAIVVGLILIIFAEAWIIKIINNRKVVAASFLHVSSYNDNYVFAEGTWRGANQKIAYPINVARIECNKKEGVCHEVTANISSDNAPGALLPLSTTDWKITKWDESEVTVDEEAECSNTKMVINFKDNAVTQIRTPKETHPADCTDSGKFITELVNGIDMPSLSQK